jgi:hypothetical protein
MGLFNSFFKQRDAVHTSGKPQRVPDVHALWDIADQNDLLATLYEHLSRKCAYGEDFEALSKEEAVLYLCQVLENEVNNGGFSQFFYNPSGNFSLETLQALKTIGACKTAAVYEKALSVFPAFNIPGNRFLRQELLDTLDQAIFDEADDDFNKNEDNLQELNIAYAISNQTNINWVRG